MIFGEWDQEKFIEVQKKIAYEDGEEATKIANAKNLLRMNLGSVEQISQAVSLSLDQVLALKEEQEQQKAQVVL